ncbi:MAG: hypothetical protein IJI41_09860 [Anaerolineaceae bacterium]|nr:hypothetical protein [Anaerolineaceae bacterium]
MDHMKKTLLFYTILLLLFAVNIVCAQEIEETEVPLSQRFLYTKIRDRAESYVPIMYYRFSPDVMFYEPIDLSYFPHEFWNKNVWVLLGRWTDAKTYNQMIYTDKPAETRIIHGTDTGASRGFLKDFYLYAALFIEDNYPADTGSCYVYYSDSLMIGLNESKGILIDPESGIYEATNSYGGARHTTYTPTTIRQSLELLQELDPADYAITPDDIESSSIGGAAFPLMYLDDQFRQDWEALTGQFRMTASPQVKAYRIEVIRDNGISTIYINGKQVFSEEDNLKTLDESGLPAPEKVSWTYGPILNEGGLTVTCAMGDFAIQAPGL